MCCCRHKYFVRGRPDYLYRVVRKTNATAIKRLAEQEKADRVKRKREEQAMTHLTQLNKFTQPHMPATAWLTPSGSATTQAHTGIAGHNNVSFNTSYVPPVPPTPAQMSSRNGSSANTATTNNDMYNAVSSLAKMFMQVLPNKDSGASPATSSAESFNQSFHGKTSSGSFSASTSDAASVDTYISNGYNTNRQEEFMRLSTLSNSDADSIGLFSPAVMNMRSSSGASTLAATSNRTTTTSSQGLNTAAGTPMLPQLSGKTYIHI
jgi:hypothetical protein